MKLFLVFLIAFFKCLCAFSTHNQGGYISYKAVAGTGGKTYDVTVTTFTKFDYNDPSSPSNQADRSSLVVSWDDGNIDTIARTGEFQLTDLIKKNTYTHRYSYSGPSGTYGYKISIEDPNRNANITNLGPNSENISFYIESTVFVSPFILENESVEFLAPKIFAATTFRTFTANPTVLNKDGDCLTFELVAPKGDGGQPMPVYFTPAGVSVNKNTGEFIWVNPSQQGLFVFVIKVSEWKNNKFVGYVTFDFQLIVEANVTTDAFFINDNWNKESFNNYSYTIAPGDSLDLNLTYSDILVDSLLLNAFGEPFEFSSNPPMFDTVYNADSITGNFKWKPDTLANRSAPYIFTFRGESNGIIKDLTLLVYVKILLLHHAA